MWLLHDHGWWAISFAMVVAVVLTLGGLRLILLPALPPVSPTRTGHSGCVSVNTGGKAPTPAAG
ncbi:hypothetical protein NE236_35590 [Actinoallomurus purpureus]|uniref:hypothetical protein n=1 Tax=Actinoallomurus purpureus TaxID=478114 RepID=UPI002093A6DF|nr:hypothetical protein [Actinoallomurus purpureus]MCO6010302.1 hypothetical protein [Actinoallomurus purpureus]